MKNEKPKLTEEQLSLLTELTEEDKNAIRWRLELMMDEEAKKEFDNLLPIIQRKRVLLAFLKLDYNTRPELIKQEVEGELFTRVGITLEGFPKKSRQELGTTLLQFLSKEGFSKVSVAFKHNEEGKKILLSASLSNEWTEINPLEPIAELVSIFFNGAEVEFEENITRKGTIKVSLEKGKTIIQTERRPHQFDKPDNTI